MDIAFPLRVVDLPENHPFRLYGFTQCMIARIHHEGVTYLAELMHVAKEVMDFIEDGNYEPVALGGQKMVLMYLGLNGDDAVDCDDKLADVEIFSLSRLETSAAMEWKYELTVK
jgi:hypothetical protein